MHQAARRGCYAFAQHDADRGWQGIPVGAYGRVVRAAIIMRDGLADEELDDCLFRGFVIALGLHLTERLAFDAAPLSPEERREALAVLRLVHHPKVTPGLPREDFFRLMKDEGLLAPYFLEPRYEAGLLHLDLAHLAAYPAPRWEDEVPSYMRLQRLPERLSRFALPEEGAVPLVVSEGLRAPLAAAIDTLSPALSPEGQPVFEVWRSGADLEALAEAYRPGGPAVPDRPHILVAQMAAERPDRLKVWPNYLFAKDNRDPDLSHFARQGCAAYRAPLPGGRVPLAAVVVDEALPPHEKEACLTLGLARALGLNVREGRDFPALTLEAADKERLRLLLELLYHPAVEPGMTRSELDAALAGAGVIATPEPVR